jgi:hypothetical protein
MSTFFEDFFTEVTDFPVYITQIPVSRILSHTGRPQEVFEKEIKDVKPKLIAFELHWDTEVTMEKVCRVLKCLPSTVQSQGFLETTALIVCSSSYYSCISKTQDNWKSHEKFTDKEPLSWVKLAWMLVSSNKYPNAIVFQRVEGYKSTSNFITSLDFENILRFAKKQDEFINIKSKNSDKIVLEPKINSNENVEGRYNYAKSKETVNREGNYPYTLHSKQLNSLDTSQLDEVSKKSSTPVNKKYESAQKPGSLDYKFQGYNEKLLKPSKFDIPKGPYRKDESLTNPEPLEKHFSPKSKENSFRSWDKNEEMERIHLDSPRDKDYKISKNPRIENFPKDDYKSIKNLRQEDSHSKLSYTPQRNFREYDKPSPKNLEAKNISTSPYFHEKYSYKDLSKNAHEGRASKEPNDIGLEYKIIPRNSLYQKNIKDEQEFYSKPAEFYSKDYDISQKNEGNIRSYKYSTEKSENDEAESRIYNKNYKNEEDVQKKPSSYSNLSEKFKYQGYGNDFEEKHKGDKQDDLYLNDKIRARERFIEENSSKDLYKPRETELDQDFQENKRFQSREYKYKEPEALREAFKTKNYEESESEVYKKNEYQNEDLNEYKIKGELKARDLILAENEPEDLSDPYSIKSPSNTNLYGQNTYSEKFNDKKYEEKYASREKIRDFHEDDELFEKYKPKTFKPKDEYSEKQPSSYNFEENYKLPSENIRKTPEDYKKYTELYRQDAKPPESYSSKLEERINQYKIKEDRPNPSYNLRNEGSYDDQGERVVKSYQNEGSSNETKEESGDWSCSKCNKRVQGNLYECSDCRLINWDQFYKVKSLQHTKIKTDDSFNRQNVLDTAAKDENGRRLYSFSDVKDENSEWVCTACYTPNKNLFFLCKSCRKPRNQTREVENIESSKKEYKFNS